MGKLWGGRWPPSEGGARVMLEGRTGLRFEGEAGAVRNWDWKGGRLGNRCFYWASSKDVAGERSFSQPCQGGARGGGPGVISHKAFESAFHEPRCPFFSPLQMMGKAHSRWPSLLPTPPLTPPFKWGERKRGARRGGAMNSRGIHRCRRRGPSSPQARRWCRNGSRWQAGGVCLNRGGCAGGAECVRLDLCLSRWAGGRFGL